MPQYVVSKTVFTKDGSADVSPGGPSVVMVTAENAEKAKEAAAAMLRAQVHELRATLYG